jgi:hypothetical protein
MNLQYRRGSSHPPGHAFPETAIFGERTIEVAHQMVQLDPFVTRYIEDEHSARSLSLHDILVVRAADVMPFRRLLLGYSTFNIISVVEQGA